MVSLSDAGLKFSPEMEFRLQSHAPKIKFEIPQSHTHMRKRFLFFCFYSDLEVFLCREFFEFVRGALRSSNCW